MPGPPARKEPHGDLELREDRAWAADAQVQGADEFGATAPGRAVDGGDRHEAAPMDPFEERSLRSVRVGGRNLSAGRHLHRHGGAGVAVHHKEVGVGAVEQQHPHVGICLASIEEVAERDRELVVEDVRWRMVDGDVRHMAVDGDGERPDRCT